MARVYSSTRRILDPNFMLSAGQQAMDRQKSWSQTRTEMAKEIEKALKGAGQMADYFYRSSLIEPDENDLIALKKELEELEAEKAKTEKLISDYNFNIKTLESDPYSYKPMTRIILGGSNV